MYFNAVYKLKNQVLTECDDEFIKVISAYDNGKGAIVLSNMSDEERNIEISISNADIGAFEVFETTAEVDNRKVETVPNKTINVTIKPRAVMVVKN